MSEKNCGRMNANGIILSLSTLLLLITVIWFSAFYSAKVERQENNTLANFAIEKAGFVAGDMAFDVNKLLGISQDVNNAQGFALIKLNGKLPAGNHRQSLALLESFLEGTYSARQNAEIRLDFNRLIDGSAEMEFSNGLLYEHAYANDLNFVQFRKKDSGNTGALSYDITLFVNGARLLDSSPWICGTEGDVNVNLRYSDSFGESQSLLGCKQSAGGTYLYSFEFVELEGSLVVSFGNVDGNINAVKVRNTIANPNIEVFISLGVKVPSPAAGLYWYYDADLNYAQQNTLVNRKILLGSA